MPDNHGATEYHATAFSGLVSRLCSLPADQFPEETVRILAEPLNWAALVLDRLQGISDNDIFDATREIIVDGVEPKTLLLHDEPGRFRIVLNHFDRESFEAHRAAGRITPHFHHFSFATRVIQGHYHQLLFSNAGELEKPRLEMWHRTRDDVDDVYFLPWDEYHCVLAPEHGTMSLQIRGSAEYCSSRPSPCMDRTTILHARDEAVEDLRPAASSGSGAAGHVPDFSQRWLPK